MPIEHDRCLLGAKGTNSDPCQQLTILRSFTPRLTYTITHFTKIFIYIFSRFSFLRLTLAKNVRIACATTRRPLSLCVDRDHKISRECRWNEKVLSSTMSGQLCRFSKYIYLLWNYTPICTVVVLIIQEMHSRSWIVRWTYFEAKQVLG